MRGVNFTNSRQESSDSPPSPHLQQLTEFNRDALPYYREACRILEGIPCNCKPEDMQKRHKDIIRSRMGDADERLAAEVRRVYEYRRGNGNKTPKMDT